MGNAAVRSKATGRVLDVASQVGGASPGTTTLNDKSRWGNDASMTNITWTQLPSRLWVPVFNGVSSYADIPGASTAMMNFTSEDYSVLGWVNWSTGDVSQIIIARYVLDNNGWEIYLTEFGGAFSLTSRHHHSGIVVDGHPRTAYNSDGWSQGTWYFMAVTRSGTTALHYRNAVSLATTFSTGGLRDAESCTQDVVIGIRYTLNANYLLGNVALLRVYNYPLSAGEILQRYEAERHLFGV